MNVRRVEPSPGQESVWDYPRPPAVENSEKHIMVYFNTVLIADSTDTKRVLETSSPPVYYIPEKDVEMQYLTPSERRTLCEWKGLASYYDISVNGKSAQNATWYYPQPVGEYAELKGHIAFYPQYMDACYVDGELVTSQPGSFYGGWITTDIVGPLKGDPGTEGW